MATRRSTKAYLKTCFAFFISIGFSGLASMPMIAQEENQSSRRESEAIKSVEDAGGRVHKISAADNSRELSFLFIQQANWRRSTASRECDWSGHLGKSGWDGNHQRRIEASFENADPETAFGTDQNWR